jgi:hypothetical protein
MLAKGMLDSGGIERFLLDDNTGRMRGIRMQVNRFDAEAATTILESRPDYIFPD